MTADIIVASESRSELVTSPINRNFKILKYNFNGIILMIAG